MALKREEKSKGPNIQQAGGLIRYFDEESDDAWQISKGLIYTVCIVFSAVIYLVLCCISLCTFRSTHS